MFQSQSGGSPHSSPSHGAGCSMPMPIRSTSAGSTPTHTPQDCLAGVGGDVLEAFAQGECAPTPKTKSIRSKAHAKSITNWERKRIVIERPTFLNSDQKAYSSLISKLLMRLPKKILPPGNALKLPLPFYTSTWNTARVETCTCF